MSIATECPRCKSRYADIPDDYAGKTATCKKCGEKFTVRPVGGADGPFIRVVCPNCGAGSSNVSRELVGRRARCSKCGSSMVIGEAPAAAQGAPPPEEEVPAAPVGKGAGGGSVLPGGWQVGATIMDLYEVREILGRGGFGTVFKARHRGWNMDLAVKTPNPGALAAMGGAENLRTEAETWVNLGVHPNIVSCYYVRELDGLPCIFAEYVAGKSLRTWIRTGKLRDVGTILDIAIQFAWGLQYAHDQGLVHQDIKPDNVMMTLDGICKVTDFGLAKAKGIPSDAGSAAPGQSIMMTAGGCTPAYASPEQLSAGKVSRKSDMWSFGLSALEMFTGGVTWPVGSVAAEVLEEYLGNRPGDAGSPAMPEPIADLLRACFREEPGERPQDMREIAGILKSTYGKATGEDYPRREPRAGRGTAGSLNNWAVSLLDLGRTEHAEKLWDEALTVEPHHLESTYNRGLTLRRSGRMTESNAVHELETAFTSHSSGWLGPYLLSLLNLEITDYETADRILQEVKPEDRDREEIRSAAGILEQHITRTALLFDKAKWGSNSVSMSRDGRYLFCGSVDGAVGLWETATGRFVRAFEGHKEPVHAVAIDSCGVLAASGGRDNTLRVWDVPTGQARHVIRLKNGSVSTLVFTNDGTRILSGGAGNDICLWDAASGNLVRMFTGHTNVVLCLTLSEDGKKFFSGTLDGAMKLWDLDAGTCLTSLNNYIEGAIESVALSGDCSRALCGTRIGGAVLWDLSTGERVWSIRDRHAPVSAVGLTSNGRFGLTSNRKDTIKLWDLQTGRCLRLFAGHRSTVKGMFFCRDDRFLLSGGLDPVSRLWEVNLEASFPVAPMMLSHVVSSEESQADQDRFELELNAAKEHFEREDMCGAAIRLRAARGLPGYEREPAAVAAWTALYRHLPRKSMRGAWKVRAWEGHAAGITTAVISADGRRILSGDREGSIKLWEADSAQCIHELKGHTDVVHSVSFSGDGRRALSSSSDCTVRIWDVVSGETVGTFQEDAWIGPAAMSVDGEVAVYLSGGKRLKVLCPSTGHSWCAAEAQKGLWLMLSVSPDGRYAVVGGSGEQATLWDLAEGVPVRSFGVEKDILSVALDCEGRRVFIGDRDGAMELWDMSNGSLLRTLSCGGKAMGVVPDRDRRYAASRTFDGLVRFWNLNTGECVYSLREQPGELNDLAFSPDWSFAVMGSVQGSMSVWVLDWKLEDVPPGEWDEGARPLLRSFLACHAPLTGLAQKDREPDAGEARKSLMRQGVPQFTEDDFKDLLYDLGCSGHGWVSPSGVRKRLDEMAANWSRGASGWLHSAEEAAAGGNEGQSPYMDALAQMEAGDEKSAMALLEKAVALERANPAHRNSLAAVYSRNGREEEAEDIWRKILSDLPDYGPAKENYAAFLSNKGIATGDISYFKSALEVLPTHYNARKELGIRYQNEGKWEEAAWELNSACGHAPDDDTKAELYDRMGTCFKNAGNRMMAVNSWEWALELKEWTPDERAAIRRDLEKAKEMAF